ncbi:hypothetical protein [Telluribacter sp.]|jgi:hypothetical protein|uniref:hypothetical protein n=1 Tax=Telluribacter sp. TaxID=1978767 RepID=UPI002E0DABF3|nr:hypothetical protein [Telluribacter sp.]
MTSNPEIHRNLDEIYSDQEALSFFNKLVFSLCLQLIAVAKRESGELTAEEADRMYKKPSEKILLEPYGISYLQYQALKDGKGTAPTMMTFKRAVERNGYDFDKLYYSEELINMALDKLRDIRTHNQTLNAMKANLAKS